MAPLLIEAPVVGSLGLAIVRRRRWPVEPAGLLRGPRMP